MISLLFAMGQQGVIGYNGDLPWRLPKDLKFFKEMTTANTVIMGRKTYQSMNGPLPNRKNVVITSDRSFQKKGGEVIHSLDTVIQWSYEHPEKEFFVIGGGNIFKQILPYADRMYMTYIDEEFPGDTYFPAFDEKDWKITKKDKGPKDQKNPYDYYFIQYDRNK